jgi:hypothetical protein
MLAKSPLRTPKKFLIVKPQRVADWSTDSQPQIPNERCQSLQYRWTFVFWGGLVKRDGILCGFSSSGNRSMYIKVNIKEVP